MFLCALCGEFFLLGRLAAAQGPQDWIKRILDPAKVGVTMPADATMNRKLTVDYLSKSDPPKEIAIYMMPIGQLKAHPTTSRRCCAPTRR